MGTDISLSLYKLSDILQMPLFVKGKKVSGKRKGVLTTEIGLKVPVQLNAKVLFAGEQIGVIVHVVGHLFLMVAHNPSKNGLSAYVIDGGKFGPDGIKIDNAMTLREVVEYLGASVVRSFHLSDKMWKELKLPK